MDFQKQTRKIVSQVHEIVRPFLTPPIKLIIGVSGGPDSLALLHVLKELYPADKLVVAHVNHGLRETAAAEAAFVRETAVLWGMPCYLEQADVIELAQQEGVSLEEAGRLARYRFFARLSAHLDARAVVVAHHADDQAETVLMHLLRGSGLAGLRGMLPVSVVPGTEDLPLIRPFLTVTRAEIEAYCQQHDLSPLQDESNRDLSFFRNRIRHELLPLLAEYNPQIKNRLGHLVEMVTADYEWLEQAMAEAWTAVRIAGGSGWVRLDKTRWQGLPISLQRAILRRAVLELRPSLRDVAFLPIEQARQVAVKGDTGAQSVLPGRLTLQVTYEWLSMTAKTTTIPHHWPQLFHDTPVQIPIPGWVEIGNGWVLEAILLSHWNVHDLSQNKDPWQAFVNIPAGEQLYLRPRSPGERFRPLGMDGRSAKAQDVMVNRKISADLRPHWPIVATQTHLVWLVGHHLDERVRVTAESQSVVQLRCYQT